MAHRTLARLGTWCVITVVTLGAWLAAPPVVRAQWSDDPSVNTPMTLRAGSNDDPAIVSDGAGGAFITWRGDSNDIYAQHVDASGRVRWGADGVTVRMGNGISRPALIPDGAGGAIIAWAEMVSFTPGSGSTLLPMAIYAQRIDAAGVAQWGAGGVEIAPREHVVVPLESGLFSQPSFNLTTDGAGGAIVAWIAPGKQSGLLGFPAYAQRVDASGMLRWSAGGVRFTGYPCAGYAPPGITSDASGGAIVAVPCVNLNVSIPSLPPGTLFAPIGTTVLQRINAAGLVQWGADGVTFGTHGEVGQTVVSDRANGFIVAFLRASSFTGQAITGAVMGEIVVQRVDASGAPQWTPGDGLEVFVASLPNSFTTFPKLISDEDLIGAFDTPGAVVAWLNNGALIAQRVNAGQPRWVSGGRLIDSGPLSSFDAFDIVGDGTGGAIFGLRVFSPSTLSDLYARRVHGNGTPQWSDSRVAISTAPGNQTTLAMAGDGAGGAIITWRDERREQSQADIYAAHLLPTGQLDVTSGPPPTPPVTTAATTPALPAGIDFHSGSVTVTLTAADGSSGLGVRRIVFSATGAQVIPATTVLGASASFVIAAEGLTTITFHAEGNDGAKEAPKTLVIDIDTAAAALQQLLITADATIAGLQSQITQLQTDLANANGVVADLTAQLAAVNQALAANATLASDLAAARATITTLNEQITSLQAQLATLTTQLATANQTIAARDATIADLQGQLAQLQGQVSALTTQNGQLQGQVSTLTSRNTRLEGQVGQLQSQVSTLTTENGQFSTQNIQLQGQVSALSTQVNTLTGQNIQLHNDLAARDALIAQLQAQLAAQTTVAAVMTTTVETGVDVVETPLRQAFNDPTFTIPGASPAQQLTNLTDAVARLNRGRLQGVYENLGGKKK